MDCSSSGNNGPAEQVMDSVRVRVIRVIRHK